jgi:hypothetical protein
MTVGRRPGTEHLGDADTDESGVVISVPEDLQLLKDSHELEREVDAEDIDMSDSEDGIEGIGVGA